MPLEGVQLQSASARMPYSPGLASLGTHREPFQLYNVYGVQAPEVSIGDRWGNSVSSWGMREAASKIGQEWLDKLTQPADSLDSKFGVTEDGGNVRTGLTQRVADVNQRILEASKPLVTRTEWLTGNAQSHRELLNLGVRLQEVVVDGKPKMVQEAALGNLGHTGYHTLGFKELAQTVKDNGWRSGWDQYKAVVRRNFLGEPALKETLAERCKDVGRNFSVSEYCKRTVIGQNVKNFTEPLTTGNLLPALATGLAVAMVGYNVLSKTRDAYLLAKAQGDGSFFSNAKATLVGGKTLIGQGMKAVATWQIASLGYAIGSAVCCIAFGAAAWPMILGGIVIGGLMAAVANKAFSTVVPDPRQRVT